jgi:uncharacterized protein
MLSVPSRSVRRFTIVRQHLSGAPKPNMLDVVRDLGCMQLDPTSAVAQSHLLVLWSRLGAYDRAELDRLLWADRSLFEYFAHAASIVLTDDLPIHRLRMRLFSTGESAWAERVRSFMDENRTMRRRIMRRLRAEGPLPASALEDGGVRRWDSTGWTDGRNVGRMLDFLWVTGRVLVAGRRGRTRQWDVAEEALLDAPPERPSQREVVRRASQRSLRALRVATPQEIREHFTRNLYPDLAAVLRELERKRVVERVRVDGMQVDHFVHSEDVDALMKVDDMWEPRTTLLSPFDNLICDRARTDRIFDFRFRLEIYTPKHLRKHGFFVMPILVGDRLIGRVNPTFDRQGNKLVIDSLHLQDGVRPAEARRALRPAAEDLAHFLGPGDVVFR